ncbi:protein-disulfide reductase DsbD family protein [Loktanella agnita]
MLSAGRQFLLFLLCILWASNLMAEVSEPYTSPAVTARLISVENAVPPNATTLSLGLDLKLEDGWKAYWRSPGEVGLPPQISWEGSQNLASAEILWPAPERFTAFGIENFGYHDRVVLPVQALLEDGGRPARLEAQVTLLTCSEICVPHDFDLSLDLPAGIGIDLNAGDLITEFANKVPLDPAASGIAIDTAVLTDDALYVVASSDKSFAMPDVFPEMGPSFTFGKPDIRTNSTGTQVWAKLPLYARNDVVPQVQITLTDGPRAVTATPSWSQEIPQPPFTLVKSRPDLSQIMAIAIFALLGGLILNVMPCVLPVLSIKLTSLLNQGDRPVQHFRYSFLMSALGVLVFMWGLAAVILILQSVGITVGWGVQFQSPAFLAVMFLVLAVFAANLFCLFEISLPSGLQTRLARSGARAGYGGDFATGAFAAVLATPCSAPFLGTAVAFALTGRPVDVMVVFTALGLGLALPYLLFAWKPGLIRMMPKPGGWMIVIKWVLGALLAGTAAWLLWVLSGVAGAPVAAFVLVMAILFAVVAAFPKIGSVTRTVSLSAIAIFSIAMTGSFTSPAEARQVDPNWVVFDRGEIPRLVSQGKTVFVDVTADWCLTCKANKALVLDRAPVADRLQGDDVTPMQADWTRSDPAISRYLESYDRFGIPFNIVYGPNAPDGLILSEVLSTGAVMTALKEAGLR